MAEKGSFLLFTKYRKQIEKLNMEERGEVLTAIFAYADEGIVTDFESPRAEMLFSVIQDAMDYTAEKYEEKCEKNRANGRRGGRPRNDDKKRTGVPNNLTDEEKPKKPNGFSENQTVFSKTLYDNEYEYDHEYDLKTNSECVSECVCDKEDEEEEAREAKPVKRRTWGYVTDKASLASCKDFAAEVIPQYFGRAPTEKDRELIFAKCRVLGENEYNGVTISRWSEEKAELLRYALNVAYAANRLDWRYIDGIWDNFTRRGIRTAAEAQEYEWTRKLE